MADEPVVELYCIIQVEGLVGQQTLALPPIVERVDGPITYVEPVVLGVWPLLTVPAQLEHTAAEACLARPALQ